MSIVNTNAIISSSEGGASSGDDLDKIHQQIDTLTSGKLDKIDYVQHFRGLFSSYVGLTAALPVALTGDYAHIDTGVGFGRLCAIYDDDDQKWVVNEANVALNTDEMPEGSANLYFKSQRVLDTPLTGLETKPASEILATDAILIALAKLQAQLKNVGTGQKVNWIDLKTIATFHTNVYLPNTTLKIANINGELWMKGSFQITAQITAGTNPIFTIPNKDWYVTSTIPEARVGLVATFPQYNGNFSPYFFGFIQAPVINEMRFYCSQSTPSTDTFHFVPFNVGVLLNPNIGLV